MPKFTTISPTSKAGEKPIAWERFRDGQYVAIGWLYNTDLTGKPFVEIQRLIRQARPEDERDALRSLPRFLELEPGDYIGVKNVNHGLFGIGKITSEYKFMRRKHFTGWQSIYYSHYMEIDWRRTSYYPGMQD